VSGLAIGFLALSILLVWGGLAVSVTYLVRHRLPDDDAPGGGVGSVPAGGEAPHP
jgi:hypothetical protein